MRTTRLLVTGLALAACTTVRVRHADPGTPVDGFAYSLPKAVIVLRPQPDGSLADEVEYVPDESRTYAIDVNNYFTKDTVDVEVTEKGFLKLVKVKPNGTDVASAGVDLASKVTTQYLADRAAEKAAKEKRVTDEIAALTTRRGALRDDVTTLDADIEKLDGEIAALTFELQSGPKEADLAAQIADLEKKIASTTDPDQKAALQSELATRKADLQAVQKKRFDLGQKQVEREKDANRREELKQESEKLKRRLDALNAERDDFDVDPPTANVVGGATQNAIRMSIANITQPGMPLPTMQGPLAYEVRVAPRVVGSDDKTQDGTVQLVLLEGPGAPARYGYVPAPKSTTGGTTTAQPAANVIAALVGSTVQIPLAFPADQVKEVHWLDRSTGVSVLDLAAAKPGTQAGSVLVESPANATGRTWTVVVITRNDATNESRQTIVDVTVTSKP